MERTTHIEAKGKNPSAIEIIQKKNLDIIDKDKEKGTIRKDIVKEMLEKIERQNEVRIEAIPKKIDIKERQRSTLVELVNKGRTNNSPRNNDGLKEKIDERLKSIERSMIYTQNDSLVELTKKIEILNSPLDINRKRDIIVLNNIELSNNEKTNKHTRNIICHKCKQYGHTKKQCDRHNKIVKQISKLEFEKDVINELMEMFDVKQKEIDQVTKKEELKSTNPLKVNKRKRKQKDIIMKLIDNLPNHLKDKKDYLLKLEDSIYIPIACIKYRKYGHYVMKCGKREKAKKEKTKMKQDGVNIKPVTLQDLMTEAKMIKQEIKEDNSTDIDEQNIAEIIILKDFSKLMIDPSSLEKDAHNRQNFLSLIDRVIFQKWHTKITLVINKEFF